MATQDTKYVSTYRDELALVRHFVTVLEQRLAGRDALRRVNTHPLDWCHLGVLGPAKATVAPVSLDAAALDAEPGAEGSAVPAAGTPAAATKSPPTGKNTEAASAEPASSPVDKGDEREEGTRRPPSAIGFELLVEPENGVVELTVDASFCLFTKHLPTWKEQCSVLATGASAGAPLADVAQRWPCNVSDLTFRLNVEREHFKQDDGAVQAVVDKTMHVAFHRADAEPIWTKATRPKVEKAEYLASEAAFTDFLRDVTAGLKPEEWAVHAALEVRASVRQDGKVRIGCYFQNETLETPPLTKGKGLKDAFKVIGDVALTGRLTVGHLHPIEILPVPQDYQYDRRVWAVGHNTSVRTNLEARTISTAALAVFEQPRIMTRDVLQARFSSLADDPFPILEAIYGAMGEYGADWKKRILAENALGLDESALTECRDDFEKFKDEVRLFAAGVAALRADPRLLTAFVAANRVMGKLARGYDAWRLFQLVFIVSQLPCLAIRQGIASGEFPVGTKRDWSTVLEWGDVLWFRTGGGKTEAYLGLACCAMLYDRLRGKNFGITAWLRFPLRMLSIQQLQRAMRVIWETEKERKALLGDTAKQSDPIRLGYFVGGTTTPNSINEEDLRRLESDGTLDKYIVVPDCPACLAKGSVKVKVDLPHLQFRHVCQKCQAELPLDISDDEVYRHLPALIVGTIDKMASVGLQGKFGMLWGGAKWKCPQHGYAFGEFCGAYGCQIKDKKLRVPVTPYDPSPALHIQDELHLLQEELGAFAGHYETLIRYCEASSSGRPSKVIAATATIEGFEHQVSHLYGVKNARRFPGRGYDKMRSFYAEPEVDEQQVEKAARSFVAFKSASMPPADASAFCTEILLQEVGKLFANPHLALAFLHDAKSGEDVEALLRYYSTTLNYVGSLAKGSRVRQALVDLASKVRPDDTRDLNVEYHSSRSSSAEVANVVHRVESPPNWKDEGFLDALVATNMISHGVDLERINLMTMDGVPDETAEYIQASSRSGRRHVGLVVVVLAGYSLRAASIYHRFIEYHSHLDRMVSPVPVNRFAKYAAVRTLPGIALGLLHGKHAVESPTSNLRQRNQAAALLQALGGKFLEEVKAAFFVGDHVYDDRLEKGLEQTLKAQLDVVQMSIRNSHEPKVGDAVRPRPMTSLRDVEVGVPFWPEADDAKLLTFVQRARE